MKTSFLNQPDLDAIARNLAYLDLAHLAPEESTAFEHELGAIASLNEALETATEALKGSPHSQLWHKLTPMLSDAAALLSSQLAPLIDINTERGFPVTDSPVEKPLALATPAQR